MPACRESWTGPFAILDGLSLPVRTPRYPCLMEGAEIAAVVGHEGLTLVRRAKEDMRVAETEAAELLCRVRVQPERAEETGEAMRDVFIQGEAEARHASGKRGRIRFEQRVDRFSMRLIVVQRGKDSPRRNVEIGRNSSDDLVRECD